MWDTLKAEIERVLEERPGALVSYPDPRSDRGREPPLRIGLAPWATDVARDLHGRFGDVVELQVGALGYPEGRRHRVPLPELGPELDPSRIEFAVDPPLEVRSGHTLRSQLHVWNRTGGEVQIVTNGGVTGYVVDSRTGTVVGGFSGAQRLPRVVFRLQPQSPELIPLVVGTASFVPDLGFAVPPGLWAVRVPLALGGGRGASTPPLPITVTP
ncbi:MAG TPA: hypothetical protein VK283_11805 [Acidimicrobiales bacterium]|nr:hypothetical protein [Acidimicrobiales bacterium]